MYLAVVFPSQGAFGFVDWIAERGRKYLIRAIPSTHARIIWVGSCTGHGYSTNTTGA